MIENTIAAAGIPAAATAMPYRRLSGEEVAMVHSVKHCTDELLHMLTVIQHFKRPAAQEGLEHMHDDLRIARMKIKECEHWLITAITS